MYSLPLSVSRWLYTYTVTTVGPLISCVVCVWWVCVHVFPIYILYWSQSIRESPLASKFTEADMEQATSFLHDSGILLHFEDSSLLNDLYFINPQWLCSMLAKLVTVRENNPFQRQGKTFIGQTAMPSSLRAETLWLIKMAIVGGNEVSSRRPTYCRKSRDEHEGKVRW